ncbi:MAG: 2-amino-3,7-dideoxy-D-threo-hept-6-ulosonate synthase [Candidatus Bathyarchaeia archaeon]
MAKEHRLGRLLNRKTGRIVIAALDHGLQHGPGLQGIDRIKEAFPRIMEGGPDAVLLNPGLVKSVFRGFEGGVGLIVKLTAFTPYHPDFDAAIGSVREALKLGADAVSVGFLFGSGYEKQGALLRNLGAVAEECLEWGLPLLVHAYPRGEQVPKEQHYAADRVKYAARAAAEVGADIVKTSYTGSPEGFREVVAACPVPVVQAGGPKADNDDVFLRTVEEAVKAGAIGVAVGRNLFMHPRPKAMLQAVRAVVHEGRTAEEALRQLS